MQRGRGWLYAAVFERSPQYGFHLAFDHPHIDKQKIEQLILEVYDEEYRRLGPSAKR